MYFLVYIVYYLEIVISLCAHVVQHARTSMFTYFVSDMYFLGYIVCYSLAEAIAVWSLLFRQFYRRAIRTNGTYWKRGWHKQTRPFIIKTANFCK